MGFGSNFFGAATAALPQGVQLGIQGVALKRQKRQDQLREEKDTMDLFLKQWKTAENDPLLQDTMLEDFTIKHGTEEGNLQSFARTFQGMGADKRKMYINNNNTINDALAGKGTTTKAQGLAANNANKAIIRSLGRVVPTDMRHIDRQLGGSDADLTRREKQEDSDRRFKFYENQSKVLEKQVQETKLLLEKSDNQEGRDFLETSIGRLKSLLQNMYANGMGFTNEFIESKFEILGIGEKKQPKERKLSQSIVDVLAGNEFNVRPEEATPKQIDAASIIVFNKKLQFEKDKRKNLTNDRAEIRKAMTNASSTATIIASLKAKDKKALDMFSDLYAHGIDKKDLDFKPAIAFAKELLVFEIKQIQRVTGKPFPLIFDREIFSEEEFKLHFKKKVK